MRSTQLFLLKLMALLVLITAAGTASAQYGRTDKRYRDRYAHSNTYGDVVEIALREPGTLEEKMPKDMYDRVRLLHIEGPMDVQDFKYLKKLCGRSRCVDANGRSTDNYIDLELERARIMSAGSTGLFNSRGEHDVLGDVLSYSSHLRSIVLPERLKRIETGALQGCYGLEEVIMPPGVRSLGDRAFASCSKLNYIVLAEDIQYIGKDCFSGCSMLSSINLPYNVMEIGDRAFEKTSLQRISLPHGLSQLGAAAFDQVPISVLNLPASTQVVNDDFGFLPKLEEATVEGGSRYYTTEDGVIYDSSGTVILLFPAARNGSFVIPDGVTTIKTRTFYGCSLRSIGCPSSVTTIGSYAFANSKRLTDVNIPEGLQQITNHTFSGCSSLLQVDAPSSVRVVGESAFNGCIQAQLISLPGVTQIGKSAFSGCKALTTITLNDNLGGIPQQAFENCSSLTHFNMPLAVNGIGEKAFKGCKQLTRLTLNEGIRSIDKEAFRECEALQSVALPSTCTSIEKEAFRGCKALSQIELNQGLNSIGDNALRETALINLTLPATITKIGKKITEKCPNLLRIECHAIAPPTLDKVSNDKIELYVPATSLETYKKAKNWKNFKRILPLP